MQPISEWLESLGLEQYAQVFADNDIDLELLPSLSDQDLEKLGVSSMGHRKKLLKAVAQLGETTTPALPATAQPLTTDTAERRHLTVMFCDLVGSTELSQKLDPETLRELMRSYQQCCGAVIEKYDGHVAQYLGDGLMTYFGWPRAHEDGAERAIRAGLEIVEAVKHVQAPEPLQVRVGIATGPVVVGETGDGDASVPKLAVGETPNVAARIQGLARADQVMIGPDTRRLVGGTFALDDSGEHTLKGIVDPMRAWHVTGEGRAEGRFDAAHGEGDLTPLVGRELELGLLMERWQLAQDGEGQVVLLSGEPGIGKSRILSALRERLKSENANAMRFQCSPYYINSAFWPSIDNFERVLKFARDEAPDSKLDKLESLIVGHYQRPLTDVRFIASMLSIPCDERYGELAMTPQKFKDETLRTLVDLTEAAAKKQPSVLFFEDLHWADPTTLELLDLAIDRDTAMPLLIVLTHRPEFQSRWTSHGHVISLNLSKLTRAQSAAMVSRVTGGKALPDDLVEQILAKTDGVPLFVEELTKSILESGELKDAGDHYAHAGKSHSVTIPATLRDSLMARLDRFTPVKEIAQVGAAIGREFSYELISAVAPLPLAQLDEALSQLTESGLAFRRGTPPDATYTFKHAMVQDAAYESLLKSRRRQIHLDLAVLLESGKDAADDVTPELLGHHYYAAGLIDRAIPCFIEAGHVALGGMALPEAVSQLKNALRVLPEIQSEIKRDRLELDVRAALGTAYMAMLGWPAKEVEDTLVPAHGLCRKAGQSEHYFTVLWGLWLHHSTYCRFDETIDLFEEMIATGRTQDDSGLEITGLMAACLTYFWMGDFARAADYRDQVLALYDFDRHRHLVAWTNHDPKSTVLAWDTQLRWITGYPDRAEKSANEMLAHADRLGHPFDSCFVRLQGAEYLGMRGEPDRLIARTGEGLARAVENGFAIYENVIVPNTRIPSWIQLGELERCLAEGRAGVEAWAITGSTLIVPHFKSGLALAMHLAGRHDEAHVMIDEAVKMAEATGQSTYLPEIYRIKGEILLGSSDDAEDPEIYFQKAIECARLHNARSWELRTSTSLARLWQSKGKKKEAHELLSPVYNWFTEGFDTKDLIEAKALLEELAA